MIEGICILAFVAIVVWLMVRHNKKKQKPEPAIKRPPMPPVKPPRKPEACNKFAIPYGQGRLVNPTRKQSHDDINFFDDIASAVEEVVEVVTERKRKTNSAPVNDCGFSPSSDWSCDDD